MQSVLATVASLFTLLLLLHREQEANAAEIPRCPSDLHPRTGSNEQPGFTFAINLEEKYAIAIKKKRLEEGEIPNPALAGVEGERQELHCCKNNEVDLSLYIEVSAATPDGVKKERFEVKWASPPPDSMSLLPPGVDERGVKNSQQIIAYHHDSVVVQFGHAPDSFAIRFYKMVLARQPNRPSHLARPSPKDGVLYWVKEPLPVTTTDSSTHKGKPGSVPVCPSGLLHDPVGFDIRRKLPRNSARLDKKKNCNVMATPELAAVAGVDRPLHCCTEGVFLWLYITPEGSSKAYKVEYARLSYYDEKLFLTGRGEEITDGENFTVESIVLQCHAESSPIAVRLYHERDIKMLKNQAEFVKEGFSSPDNKNLFWVSRELQPPPSNAEHQQDKGANAGDTPAEAGSAPPETGDTPR